MRRVRELAFVVYLSLVPLLSTFNCSQPLAVLPSGYLALGPPLLTDHGPLLPYPTLTNSDSNSSNIAPLLRCASAQERALPPRIFRSGSFPARLVMASTKAWTSPGATTTPPDSPHTRKTSVPSSAMATTGFPHNACHSLIWLSGPLALFPTVYFQLFYCLSGTRSITASSGRQLNLIRGAQPRSIPIPRLTYKRFPLGSVFRPEVQRRGIFE